MRRLKLTVPLPSEKLINNSLAEKIRKLPHPHPSSLTLLLSALVSPQGSGADRWWKETGSKGWGGSSLFLVPVLKFFKELQEESFSALLSACSIPHTAVRIHFSKDWK